MVSLNVTLKLLLLLTDTPSADGQKLSLPKQVGELSSQCEAGIAAGQYAQVLPMCQKAVATLEHTTSGLINLAEALNNLGLLYTHLGDYRRAKTCLVRSLVIMDRSKIKNNPSIASVLLNLGSLFMWQGAFSKAESYFRRSLAILENTAKDQPSEALALYQLAGAYLSQGNYVKAEPLLERSVGIYEKARSPASPEFATALISMAKLRRYQGKHIQAGPFYKRGLEVMESALGNNSTGVAFCLIEQANWHQDAGEYSQAEIILRRSLNILENSLGKNHPERATCINNLALLYQLQGKFDLAEPLWRHSLKIREMTLGRHHPDVAQSLNNLATLYVSQRKYEQAGKLLARGLAILESKFGRWHYYTASYLNNLAEVYRKLGRHTEARTLYLRSLGALQKSLGREHPRTIPVLSNLGTEYYAEGNNRRAEQFYQQSIGLTERTFGKDHPELAKVLGNLARLRLRQGEPGQALLLFQRILTIREISMRNSTTEARVSAFLDLARIEGDFLNSLLLRPALSTAALPLVMRSNLLSKGRTAEAGLLAGHNILRSLTTDFQRQCFRNWQSLREQHQSLALRAPESSQRLEYQHRLAELEQKIDMAEQEMVRATSGFLPWRVPKPENIVSEVAAKLPSQSVLVDFLIVYPFRASSKRTEEGWEAPHYIALFLFPDQTDSFIDLGPADQIDKAVEEFLRFLGSASNADDQSAFNLYQLVFLPLVSKLRGVTQIFLSPDGSLNLIPFAALHDGKRYMLDSPYRFVYLGSGRDLLRGPLAEPPGNPLILAGPDFDAVTTEVPDGKLHTPQPTIEAPASSRYQSLRRLPALPGSRAEGERIGSLLGVVPLLDAAATEEALHKTRAPWILHIATHGLFFGDDDGVGETGDSRSALLKVSPETILPRPARAHTHPLYSAGPARAGALYRSGLALAGAAHAAEVLDTSLDGLLTAEEAQALNLFGTKLVVLSACGTGRGFIRAGQGVYGLQRAFLAAGAETVVASLWRVDDMATKALIERYYELLLDRQNPRGRVSGLWEAMRAVRAERTHPHYWAPFIAVGQDGPMGQRPPSP